MLEWQPSASINNLKARAKLIASIRNFFAARDVLEVETPLLCHTSVTDPFIESIPASVQTSSQVLKNPYYLQTSPEYAMKRLLANSSGAIFQICKAFRQGKVGRLHNPEFTMLEWYRPGFNHHQLMDEMDDLLQLILQTPKALRMTYAKLFQQALNLNPHEISVPELKVIAKQNHIHIESDIDDKSTWFDLLMTHCIEPNMQHDRPYFIYDFPAEQAALARIQNGTPKTAARFEVYFKGIELANGFHELQDAKEQRKRFENNLHARKKLDLTLLPIDEHFLAALEHGLPDCAGVALGVDRLVMLALSEKKISDIISFDFERS